MSFSFLSLLAAVVALSVSIPVASASPQQPSTTVNYTSWAYGGLVGRTVSATGPNGSYSAHFYFAWKVLFNLTTTSSTTFQIEVQRTMAAALYEDGKVSTASANLTILAWELDTGFANFTTAGSVWSSVSPDTPALGLLNENAWSSGNITEVLSANWQTLSGPQKGYLYASVAAQTTAQVSFLPALGLFPLSPTQGESWNSSSAFNANAMYSLGWHVYGHVPWGSVLSTSGGSPMSFQGSGVVALNGTDYGTITFGNDTAAVIGITVSSPTFSFDEHEGILLIPTQGNLFNSGTLNSSGVQGAPGSQVFSTERIDVSLAGAQHGGIVAASSRYGSSSVFGSTPANAALISNAMPATTGPTAVLQATPLSLADAQSWCLYNCPAQPSQNLGRLGGILLLAIIAVVIAVVVVVATRRRAPAPPPPPPMYARPAQAGQFPPVPPPPNDGKDPVGFYW